MVTIKQIAQEVGISSSTVSIVLGGKAAERKISTATQEKIFAAAARLGYQPNMAARSLRGGSGANELVVAMFWAQDFRASMMLRFWDGLRAEIEKTARPVRLVIYPYVNDHLKESEALTSGANCHAAIICNASYADLQFLEDTQLPIPVVLYNRVCNGYCSVNVDDLKMGALAARAFADQGCRTAAVLTSSPVFEGMENRMHGFRLEGEHHGLTILANRYCENSIRGGYEAVSHRLRHEWKQQLPDAVFCGSSAIAHGALRAFCEAGYIGEKLPRLIAVGNGPEEIGCVFDPEPERSLSAHGGYGAGVHPVGAGAAGRSDRHGGKPTAADRVCSQGELRAADRRRCTIKKPRTGTQNVRSAGKKEQSALGADTVHGKGAGK